jgi:hypothetical protein
MVEDRKQEDIGCVISATFRLISPSDTVLITSFSTTLNLCRSSRPYKTAGKIRNE